MSLALAVLPTVRMHISLNVSSLERSIAFYKILFNTEPAKQRSDYAKFEPDDPPLVLSLEPNGRCGEGTLNHLGVRLLEERPHVGAALPAGADEGDVHLVARGHEAAAAQDVPRHDRKHPGGRRGGLEKLAA